MRVKRAMTMTGCVVSVVFGIIMIQSRVSSAQRAGGGGNRLLDNNRVAVQRLTTAPGMREQPHAHANDDYVTIQLTAGDFEVTVGTETTKGAVGKAWWLPRGVPHAVANIGTTPVDVIVVTVK